MVKDFFDGAIWTYHDHITNDGANSGTHIRTLSPGTGNEIEVLYGWIFNADSSTRNGYVRWFSSAEGGGYMVPSQAITAGGYYPFPNEDIHTVNGGLASPARYVLAGLHEARITLEAVAVSQDSEVTIVCRIFGGIPTVVLTSPTDAVEVVDINRVE